MKIPPEISPIFFHSTHSRFSVAAAAGHQFRGDMDELNDAGTYFDLGPRKVTRSGTYHYMCTRNNNFSNRSQKGKLIVTVSSIAGDYLGQLGGTVAVTRT